MKKGVSTIIATILLLLITIAIVGFAFGFFQRFFGTATGAGQQQLIVLQNQTGQAVRIEATTSTAAVIRNIGTVQLTPSQIGVFINSAPVGCTWTPSSTIIPANNVSTCTFTGGSTCAPGSALTVTTPGLSDTRTC